MPALVYTHLCDGKPRPRIPAPPFATAELSVLLMAASVWSGKLRAASVTLSYPTGPLAWVPLVESPYCRLTEPPEGLKVLEVS